MKILTLVLLMLSSLHAQRPDLNGLKFCIDPGHGGNNPANDRLVIPDPGIEFWESESNFQKALLLKPMLEEKGGWVILTRYTNYYPNDNDEPSLTARWQLANANNVHWFHSIHSNATGGTNTGTNYTMILIKEDIPTRQPAFPQAVTMSNLIYTHIRAKNRTGASGGNIAPGVYLDYTFYSSFGPGYNLGVLKGLIMPGQLSEGSFHDYFPETRRLMNNHYRKMEAYGILNGFLAYYGVPFDTTGIIAGIQTDNETNKPKNATVVRLLPENIVYNGDNYNNGYYLFDRLVPGPHTVKFETPGYGFDSVNVNVAKGSTNFVDKMLYSTIPPYVMQTQPVQNDTAFKVNYVIGIKFSKPMDTASVRLAFSMTPNVAGNFQWGSSNTMLLFSPKNYLQYNTRYMLKISETAKSMGGILIDGNNDGTPGDPFILNFKTENAPTSVPEENLTKTFKLYQNYPNPFNPITYISYSLPMSCDVSLKIFDCLGREIDVLVNQFQSEGFHRVHWDASNFQSGVYFVELKTEKYREIKKLTLIK
ncbi:MAG: N-acetylmuramoyl-L-alanine amidase [Ignavibacteria bacterium]|nr:N-acetylmuramoyl-L-alanine amidase [Ignavibacteria bacterium]